MLRAPITKLVSSSRRPLCLPGFKHAILCFRVNKLVNSPVADSRGQFPTTLAQLDPPSKMSYILRDLPPAIVQVDTETIRATKGTSELITRPSIVSIGIHQIRYTLTLFDLDDTGVLCYSQS